MTLFADIKYFKSFAAPPYPIEPLDKIQREEAEELTTYYEALYDSLTTYIDKRYDTVNQLREFTKHLRQRNADDNLCWVKMFIEKYEYWPSGQLKRRCLTDQKGETQSWNFDDKPVKWTSYLSDWFRSRQGQPEDRAGEPSLAERLNDCHERVNQIEADTFENASVKRRSNEWAFETISKKLSEFKQVFESIVPEGRPRVSFFASKEDSSLQSLQGFDILFNDSAVFYEAWNELAKLRTRSPVDLLALVHSQPDITVWLQDNGIAAGFALAVLAFKHSPLSQGITIQFGSLPPSTAELAEVAGHLVLWLGTPPTMTQAAAIASLFRRLGHFVQIVIALAQEGTPIIHEPMPWKTAGF